MTRDKGPPEKERPSGYQAARPDHQQLADTTTNQHQGHREETGNHYPPQEVAHDRS
jgi:hypothetical protein